MPLARFRFSKSGISLGTSTISLPANLRSISCNRDEVKQVFRAKGPGFGVGIDTVDGKTHYFWTFRRNRILTELTESGYAVGADRHPRWLNLQAFPVFPKDRS
jgi:hypothetical protein